jgi:aminoglycoside phosphotransferase (APT) family kinase protein
VARRRQRADNRGMAEPDGNDGALRGAAASVPQDWAALARWLAARGMALSPEPPRQFAGGFGNLNYRLVVDGEPVVLRRPPAGPLPVGANDMAREHRILSVLWRAYPLAPRAIAFCPDPGVLGAPFQLIEYRPGIVIRDALPPGAAGNPQIGAALSRHLVDALAALHAVSPAAVGLDTLGRPQGFLARTLAGWERRGAALADLIEPRSFAETVAWLRRQVPEDGPACLIHSDFKLDNLILDRGSLAPAAVIDWDMGTQGDPLWDLAVMLSYWAEPGDPDCMHRLRQMPTLQAGFWRHGEVVEAYRRLSGRPVADFPFYRVLALFRSAIVFLQLFDRYRRQAHPNPDAANFDRLGRELLIYALDTARGRKP